MAGRGYRELPPDAPPPRLCVIQKQSVSQEYGFNLHAEKEKGQFIGIVDPGSPADLGGLKQGDRIFAVNGVSIIDCSHKNVVAQIKSDPLKCEMLVVSNDDFEWYSSRNIPVDMTLPNIIRVCEEKRQPASGKSAVGGGQKPSMAPPARLSRLQKQSPADEFGFNLHAERGKGHFIGSVDKGGIADRAGLVMGQRIVGVNDTLIYPNTPHKDVVSLIKKDPLRTELLVVSEEIDRWYTENGVEFSFDNCVRYNSDPSASESRNDVVESSIHMEKLTVQDETVESHPVDGNSPEGPVSEVDETIKQVTTVSTTQTISVTEVVPDTPEDTDELIDKIFKDVPLQPVGAFGTRGDSTDSFAKNGESSSENVHTRVSSSAARESSPKPATQVPLVIPPNSVTRSQSGEKKSQKLSSYTSPPVSRSNGSSNGVDLFQLSAKEARQMLSKQKKDPRKNNISLEQKHQLIANL